MNFYRFIKFCLKWVKKLCVGCFKNFVYKIGCKCLGIFNFLVLFLKFFGMFKVFWGLRVINVCFLLFLMMNFWVIFKLKKWCLIFFFWEKFNIYFFCFKILFIINSVFCECLKKVILCICEIGIKG